MTTPATREELRDMLARAIWGNITASGLGYADRALTVLEQHGLALVPVEATEAMLDAINNGRNAPLDSGQIWDDALAASPYNKGTGNG